MPVTIGGYVPWQQETAKTASYTVLSTDAGTLFTNTGAAGAVTFTLPALAAANVGIGWYFMATAAQNLIITAPANKFIMDGNATATTATYSTASHIIGAFCLVSLNAAGTFYLLTPMNSPGIVLTVS